MTLSMPKTDKKTHLRLVSSGRNSENAIRCHVHGEPIVTDCKLGECVFHTAYPNVNNCVLVYMAKQNVESLKAIDIGMLKGIPASRVSRDLARATTAMRNGTLKVSNQTDIEPKFTTLPDLDVCYACETPITGRHKKTSVEFRLSKKKQRIVYCTQACVDDHPPQFVAAEMECRSDIKTVTEWAVKRYSTLGGLEQALGMNRQLLGDALKRLLNLDAEEIYSTTQRVKTRSKALVRRTGSRPEWLSKFSDILEPLVAEMEGRYGEATIDLGDISEEVQTVIDTI
jgi:hypothetical protein